LFNHGRAAHEDLTMMMKRWIKRTLFGLLGASALLGGFAAWAHSRHGWHPMNEQDAVALQARMVDKVAHRLELDTDQRARLAVLGDRLREQRTALLGAAGNDPRTEVQSLIAGPTFDRAKASLMVETKVSAVNAKSPAVIAALADFYDSLRPDQQAKVRELTSRHRSTHG
jgi:Spy/CpxP family protein refolding chaperone